MRRKYSPPTTVQAVRAIASDTDPSRVGSKRRGVMRCAIAVFFAETTLFAAPGSTTAPDNEGGESAPSQQGPGDTSNDREHAAARFQQGIGLYKAGRYAEAFSEFIEAQKLYPSPAFSFNLARASERMNDTAKALRYYREYLREAPNAEDLEDVSERIRTLEQALALRGVQQVTVLSEPDGATVNVDDKAVGITPWTGELRPGSHSLTLFLSGYEDVADRLDLPPDRAVDVTLRLTRAVPKPVVPTVRVVPVVPNAKQDASRELSPSNRPTESDVAPGSGARVQPWTWGVFAGSAVALAGAGVYELFRRHGEGEVSRHDTQLARLDEYQTMKTNQRSARILLGVGGGLALVGGGLLLWDLSSPGEAAPARRGNGSRYLGRHGPAGALSARVGCDGELFGFFVSGGLE